MPKSRQGFNATRSKQKSWFLFDHILQKSSGSEVVNGNDIAIFTFIIENVLLDVPTNPKSTNRPVGIPWNIVWFLFFGYTQFQRGPVVHFLYGWSWDLSAEGGIASGPDLKQDPIKALLISANKVWTYMALCLSVFVLRFELESCDMLWVSNPVSNCFSISFCHWALWPRCVFSTCMKRFTTTSWLVCPKTILHHGPACIFFSSAAI